MNHDTRWQLEHSIDMLTSIQKIMPVDWHNPQVDEAFIYLQSRYLKLTGEYYKAKEKQNDA